MIKEIKWDDLENQFALYSLKEKKQLCEVCNKKLNIGDTVRPFGIGGGWMYWCKDCDNKYDQE